MGDSTGQVAELLQRRVGVDAELVEEGSCGVGVAARERLGVVEAMADLEQLMRGTFADIALQASALLVARGHEPLT